MLRNPGVEIKQILAPVFLPENKKLQVTMKFFTKIGRKKESHILYKQKVEPLKEYKPPVYQIHMLGIRARKITLWEGTADEREIMFLGDGGGALIEGDIGNCIYIMPEIPFTDNETIDKYELTNVRIYAEFNERLYLCYKFGKNVDPMKDLVFNRPIPIEYKEYIDIISS